MKKINKKQHPDGMLFLILFVWKIFDNIRNFTIEDSAEIVDLHGADSFAFFHPVYGCTADVVFVDQRIGSDVLLF